MGRRGDDILSGRSVSTGSVFSTVLIATVIERSAPERRVALLVDVGSGDSPYRYVLEHEEYVGIDRFPRGRDALLVTADAGALPVASGVADGVLCTEVIEHVPDEDALARELARVASTDATLVLSSPFVHGLHEAPHDFRRLTSIGLVRVLGDAGWVVDAVVPVGGPLVVATDSAVRWGTSRVRAVARRLPLAAVRDALLRLPEWVQRRLAAVALRGATGRCARIDPFRATPTLTLGYVVVARRAPDT